MAGPDKPPVIFPSTENESLAATAGRKVYCAADFMGQDRQLLEAERRRLYEEMPVPGDWHDNYAKSRVNIEEYFDALRHDGEKL